MDARSQEPLVFVTDFLARTFSLPAQRLAPEATFSSLDLDSIAQVELFVTLSDHFGIQLDDSQAHGELTLQQTADLVRTGLADVDRGSRLAQG
ncbi:acyl carrier protein [Streptomyces sp. NPDC054949]|uniref:acyl carrier protein n=1 Tax=unclassified Streptomyces TaxID=2593676 RepID=UPI00224F85D0|nr:acyl carrier protein [Streptomyces sp. NBC_00424]MCX5071003.1 acyl carrier protein [Streptomyces sp. NBC_00424]WUD45562.1 acyl carrier protein [Streptomyces sp. NBC_00513]